MDVNSSEWVAARNLQEGGEREKGKKGGEPTGEDTSSSSLHRRPRKEKRKGEKQEKKKRKGVKQQSSRMCIFGKYWGGGKKIGKDIANRDYNPDSSAH